MDMKKLLTNIGSSLGFIVDKPIAELYQFDTSTEVEFTPKENGLSIFIKSLPSKAADDDVMKVAKDVNKRYGKMMKNLAK